MFYLCDFNKGWNDKKSKKSKRGTSSEVSKKSSSSKSSEKIMTAFSLKDLSRLNTKELASKVFSFQEELTKQGVKPDEVDNLAFKDEIIANLACMRDIDKDFLPEFKFIQIKKSSIRTPKGQKDKDMICFMDISQKILYDTTKAESELLSLINSTISHEMRNPLNSILNQCKII